MKTQITQLEKQVLLAIQKFTSEDFGSDNGNWAYVHEIAETVEIKKLRALISTLSQKGILELVEDYDSFLEINKNYYKETRYIWF